MSLVFPNARLLLHNFLLKKMSGAKAIAAAASHYNLVEAEAVRDILQMPDLPSCCCNESGRRVVQIFFAKQDFEQTQSKSPMLPLVLREAEAWQQVMQQYNEYDPLNCTVHAPALFDIILQVLGRYH